MISLCVTTIGDYVLIQRHRSVTHPNGIHVLFIQTLLLELGQPENSGTNVTTIEFLP